MKPFKGISGWWRRLLSLLCVGSVVVVLSACGGGSGGSGSSAAGGGKIKIGLLLGLTGSYAALGEPEREAIELYFQEVNAAGGVGGKQVELVVADTTSDEGTAVNQLRKLVTQDQVVAVLGPSSSGESIAVKNFSKQLKIPVISLASAEAIVTPPEDAKYMFKEFIDTRLSIKAQLELAKQQNMKRIALLSTNDGYGQDAAKSIQPIIDEYGMELVANETFDAKATDVTAQLGKIAGSNPEMLLVWAVNPANAIVAKSAASIKFKPQIFHSPGAGSPAYITNAGAAAEGTLLQGSKVLAADSIPADDPQKKPTDDLVNKYKAKYNKEAGQYAANGWDGCLLLANGLKGEIDTSSPQKARDAIRDNIEKNTQNLVGVNAIYTFRSDFHGPTGLTGLTALKVEGGKFKVEKSY